MVITELSSAFMATKEVLKDYGNCQLTHYSAPHFDIDLTMNIMPLTFRHMSNI